MKTKVSKEAPYRLISICGTLQWPKYSVLDGVHDNVNVTCGRDMDINPWCISNLSSFKLFNSIMISRTIVHKTPNMIY